MNAMRNSSEKLWYGSTALTRLGSRNSAPISGSQQDAALRRGPDVGDEGALADPDAVEQEDQHVDAGDVDRHRAARQLQVLGPERLVDERHHVQIVRNVKNSDLFFTHMRSAATAIDADQAGDALDALRDGEPGDDAGGEHHDGRADEPDEAGIGAASVLGLVGLGLELPVGRRLGRCVRRRPTPASRAAATAATPRRLRARGPAGPSITLRPCWATSQANVPASTR